MRIHLRRLVKDRITKEEIVIAEEVRRKDLQCIYKDQYGVFLSMRSGMLIKVDHTLREMTGYFLENLDPREICQK